MIRRKLLDEFDLNFSMFYDYGNKSGTKEVQIKLILNNFDLKFISNLTTDISAGD